MNIRIAIHRFERGLLRRYNFLLNFWFFLDLGYSIRRAWNAARDTL